MPTGNNARRWLLPLLFLFLPALESVAQAPADAVGRLTPAQAQSLVARALASELRAAQDQAHPMRYLLRKTTPRLTSAKEIVETRDGEVAHLVSINDQPLSAAAAQREQARLEALAANPNLQRHRKKSEDSDMEIVLKLLHMLPTAFTYQYAGMGAGPNGVVEKYSFKPNPQFSPPDLETQALTALNGEVWVDAAQGRVVRLEGHLQQDTDYGWGVLGKLDKGGWVAIEQADEGGGQWRIVHVQMRMNLRVLFRTRNIDTLEDMSRYEPVPAGMDYRHAIQMLLEGAGNTGQANR